MTFSLHKKVILFLFVGLIFQQVQAQRSEVGFGLGTFTYTGELVRNYNFKFSKPAATVFYRANLNRVVSFRTSITAGKIGASEKPIDPFATQRNASFNLFLLEASGVIEYHFLNWRETKRFVRFTPYAFGGLGLFSISGDIQKTAEYSNIQLAIPFGIGLKYVYNPKWYFSLEAGVRKTFFDYLDNISAGDVRNKNYHYGNANDNDAYYFVGITITRAFYVIPCPKNPYK